MIIPRPRPPPSTHKNKRKQHKEIAFLHWTCQDGAGHYSWTVKNLLFLRPFRSWMFQNFNLFGNDLAIQYTVVTRIETRVTKTPGETFVSSVQFSCSVVSDSLGPRGLKDARLPCPSPTPGACSNSSPSGQWCHPTILSSVVPFSSAFNQDYERQIF